METLDEEFCLTVIGFVGANEFISMNVSVGKCSRGTFDFPPPPPPAIVITVDAVNDKLRCLIISNLHLVNLNMIKMFIIDMSTKGNAIVAMISMSVMYLANESHVSNGTHSALA